MMLNNLTTGMW